MIPRWMQRRLGLLLIVFIVALIFNFIIPRLMPGDITDFYMQEIFPDEVSEGLRVRFGLDKPIMTQFWLYIKNVFTGNYGISLRYYPLSVRSMLATALPRSLTLIVTAEVIYTIIGYFLGVKAGWKAGSKTDSAITGTSMFIWAAPMFWVAMIILYIFAFKLEWFPLGGYSTSAAHYSNVFAQIGDIIYHGFLPLTTLIICRFGAAVMVMRNTITITLKENYIVSAHAKGLSERRVKHRHAARNALLPLVTSTSFSIAFAVSGSVFIETIFSYPGMGSMIFDAVLSRDYPVVQGAFLFYTLMIIAVIFFIDLVYARIDPRVRHR